MDVKSELEWMIGHGKLTEYPMPTGEALKALSWPQDYEATPDSEAIGVEPYKPEGPKEPHPGHEMVMRLYASTGSDPEEHLPVHARLQRNSLGRWMKDDD